MSIDSAEKWANHIKKWPGIFQGFNPRRVRIVEDGCRMEVGVVDVIERHLLVAGVWDRSVGSLISSLLDRGDVFLDVGANIGYFSLRAAKIVGPEGLVVSCEPSLRALTRFTKNVSLNEVENILLLSAACGSSSGTVEINLSSESNIGASAIRRTEFSIGRTEKALLMRIDDQRKLFGFVPKLIKIDVEGFELEVLRGAKNTLVTDRPMVILELSLHFLRQNGHSAEELVGFMKELGYSAYELVDSLDLVSFRALDLNSAFEFHDQVEVLFSCIPTPFANSS